MEPWEDTFRTDPAVAMLDMVDMGVDEDMLARVQFHKETIIGLYLYVMMEAALEHPEPNWIPPETSPFRRRPM
jgi:hypothetical protein